MQMVVVRHLWKILKREKNKFLDLEKNALSRNVIVAKSDLSR